MAFEKMRKIFEDMEDFSAWVEYTSREYKIIIEECYYVENIKRYAVVYKLMTKVI